MMVINYPEFSTESDSKLLSLALKKRNKPKQNASFLAYTLLDKSVKFNKTYIEL